MSILALGYTVFGLGIGVEVRIGRTDIDTLVDIVSQSELVGRACRYTGTVLRRSPGVIGADSHTFLID